VACKPVAAVDRLPSRMACERLQLPADGAARRSLPTSRV